MVHGLVKRVDHDLGSSEVGVSDPHRQRVGRGLVGRQELLDTGPLHGVAVPAVDDGVESRSGRFRIDGPSRRTTVAPSTPSLAGSATAWRDGAGLHPVKGAGTPTGQQPDAPEPVNTRLVRWRPQTLDDETLPSVHTLPNEAGPMTWVP